MRSVEDRFLSRVDKEGPGGCWIWKGYMKPDQYGQILIGSKMLQAHRASFQLFVGEIPDGMQIDHLCHCKACVNPAHLRLATPSENQFNRPLNKNSSSGYKGVSWHKCTQRWRAHIGIHGRQISLGYYPTAEAAHAAYCEAAKRLHGEFANFGTNPNPQPMTAAS